MDLNLMINDSLAELKNEGFVERVVKAQLQKTIESLVHDTLRDYSEFGKGLKSKIEEQLRINLGNLDIPSYNLLIVETIKHHLNAVIHEQGVNRMKEQLDEISLHAKEEYKLSELMKELEDEIDGLDEIGYEEAHSMTLIIDREFSLTTRIYFDAESDKSKYDCKYLVSVARSHIV